MYTNNTKETMKRQKPRMSWEDEQKQKKNKKTRFVDKRQAFEIQK